MKKAVFIDKDGTLIVDVPYNVNPDYIALMPEAGNSLRQLKDAGYGLFVVSNQSGVARGLFRESALKAVEERINQLLKLFGTCIDDFYFCPHLPEGHIAVYAIDCECRKPGAGLLKAAARDFDLDLKHSWMIGDITTDSEAGKRAGCRTILIEKAYDPLTDLNEQNRPDFIVTHWNDACNLILSHEHIAEL